MIKKHLIDLALNFFMWLWVFLSPTLPLITAIGFFVFSDAITGIIASKKQNIPFTSKRLRPTLGKFTGYGLGIMIARFIEVLFIPSFPAMKTIAGFIAYIELKSLNENLEKITGHNLFKAIIEKIKI